MKKHISSHRIDSSRFAWVKLLRIGLGIVLIWKAINFLHDTAALQTVLGGNIATELTKGDGVLILILGVITLLTGFFILIGRFTRIASFIQLPVFMFGTLFIHGGYVERDGLELALTVIIPFLLLGFITKDNEWHSRVSREILENKRAYHY